MDICAYSNNDVLRRETMVLYLVSPTVLNTNIPLSLYPWKTDTDMYSLISTWDDITVRLHPVPWEGVTRALHNIEGCVDKIIGTRRRKSTQCLIDILKKTL